MLEQVAIVIIGRNEGERLKACLRSAQLQAEIIVYVDSGSNDGSVAFAQELGAIVLELDQYIPFTAARARNAGFQKAVSCYPHLRYVQFVDGDCEIQKDWVANAVAFMDQQSGVAAVCGRRRERFPQKTIYNQLCDWEWDVTAGPTKYCGGDVMIRAEAFKEVNGYRDSLIAGEEPELCVRLRAAHWQIHVLAKEMTLHDAAMTSFSQWWRRSKRSGYAYAAGAWLHGRTAERHWVWESLRAWIWCLGPAGFALVLMPSLGSISLFTLMIYPIQVVRLIVRDNGNLKEKASRAYFNTISRFPELAGQLQFLRDLYTGRSELIEYK